MEETAVVDDDDQEESALDWRWRSQIHCVKRNSNRHAESESSTFLLSAPRMCSHPSFVGVTRQQ